VKDGWFLLFFLSLYFFFFFFFFFGVGLRQTSFVLADFGVGVLVLLRYRFVATVSGGEGLVLLFFLH